LPFRLRVVDADGEPFADVRVIVTDPETPGLVLLGSTDARGACSIQGVPSKCIVADLQPITSKRMQIGRSVCATRRRELERAKEGRLIR
jgi:hypothetical protein